MALAQAVLIPDYVDAETGIPKVELRRMLDDGLTELVRGEGIEMDAAAWDRLRSELRARRGSHGVARGACAEGAGGLVRD